MLIPLLQSKYTIYPQPPTHQILLPNSQFSFFPIVGFTFHNPLISPSLSLPLIPSSHSLSPHLSLLSLSLSLPPHFTICPLLKPPSSTSNPTKENKKIKSSLAKHTILFSSHWCYLSFHRVQLHRVNM